MALNTPFNYEVLEGGKYGVLFDKNAESLKTQIESLEQNLEKVEDFRQRATEQIHKRFNWDHIAEQYIDVFNELQKK